MTQSQPPAAKAGKGKGDPVKPKPAKEFKHNSPLIGCRIDPSGRFAFASAQDNTLQRWDLASGKRTPFEGHRSWVRALAFDKAGKTLFSADWMGRILAWPVEGEKPKPRRTIEAHRGWARALAVSPDGQVLASGGNDHRVRLWSTTDGKPLGEFAGHESHVYNVAFHPDGKSLVSADLKGVVKVWDMARKGGAAVRQLDAGALYKYDPTFRADIGGVRSMAFAPGGEWLACAGITEVSNAFAGVGKPLIVLFDWKTGKRTLLKPKAPFVGTMWGVRFHPDGFVIGVAGGNGGMLGCWKPDGDNFFTLKLPNNARDLDLHPDGHRLAVAFFDGAVRLYEMGTA